MYYDFLDRDLEIKVVYTNRSGYSIKIVGQDSLEIRSGSYLEEEDIREMLYKHRRFLNTHLPKNKEKRKDIIHYFGKVYPLVIIDADYDYVFVDEYKNEFKVYTKSRDDSHIKYVIYSFYETTLKNIIARYNDKIKQDFKIKFDPVYEIKEVKTYYGECFKSKKLIILSVKLAKYELKYILSVIYHEFTHFYVSGHSEKFYDLLEGVYPNYKKTQADLRKIRYEDFY